MVAMGLLQDYTMNVLCHYQCSYLFGTIQQKVHNNRCYNLRIISLDELLIDFARCAVYLHSKRLTSIIIVNILF